MSTNPFSTSFSTGESGESFDLQGKIKELQNQIRSCQRKISEKESRIVALSEGGFSSDDEGTLEDESIETKDDLKESESDRLKQHADELKDELKDKERKLEFYEELARKQGEGNLEQDGSGGFKVSFANKAEQEAFHNMVVDFLKTVGLKHDSETKGNNRFVTIHMPPSCQDINMLNASEAEWGRIKDAASKPSYAQYVERKRSGEPDLPKEVWKEMDRAFDVLKASGVGQLEGADVNMSGIQKESWVEKYAEETKDPDKNIKVATR